MTDFRGKGGVQPDGSTSGKKKGKAPPFVKGKSKVKPKTKGKAGKKGKPFAKKAAAPPRPSPIQAAMAPPMAAGGGYPGC